MSDIENEVRELTERASTLEGRIGEYRRLFSEIADFFRRLGSGGLDPEVARIGLHGAKEGTLAPRNRDEEMEAVLDRLQAEMDATGVRVSIKPLSARDRSTLIAEAQRLVERGKLERAVNKYRELVAKNGRDIRIWLKIGDLEVRLDRKHSAVEAYLKVADAYTDQGFFLKAVAVYRQILNLDPSMIEVNLRLADLYKHLELFSDAMQQYETIATELTRLGRGREALAALRQMVEIDPKNLPLRIRLAEAYQKADLIADASEEFRTALNFVRGDDNETRETFASIARKLLYLQPDDIELSRELGAALMSLDQPREALTFLQTCFQTDPHHVETLILIARAFAAVGQNAKAREFLQKVLEKEPESAVALELLISVSKDDAK